MRPSKTGSVARTLSRLGWIGFWLQVVLGSVPIVLMIYYFIFSPSPTISRSGFLFVEYLTIASLLVLVFTTLWSYRYTRLAKRIANPDRRPPQPDVVGSVWTGVVASTVGMLFSMAVIITEAAHLLFLFVTVPAAGVPVIQTSAEERGRYVSAADMFSLIALILVLFAELLVLVFGLWLLFRANLESAEYPQAAAGHNEPVVSARPKAAQ
jgi:hypothetical protein